MSSATRSIQVIPVPHDIPLAGVTFVTISTAGICIPASVFDLYGHAVQMQLNADIQNAELKLASLDINEHVIPGETSTTISNGTHQLRREIGTRRTVTGMFRGLNRTLNVVGRKVDNAQPYVARNVTIILYLGDTPIG